MKQPKATNFLIALALAIFLFGSGYKIGEFKGSKGEKRSSYSIKNLTGGKAKELDFNLFWETWDKVEEKFIDQNKLDPQKMYYGAVKGLVSSLDDPYTFFLTPDENQQSKDDLGGKFEGIGAQLGLKNNRITIISPLKDSPAEKAGLRPGDIIVKVDGKETKNWSLVQAVTAIRGEKGTKVSLNLQRGQKNFDVSIVREQIKVSSIDLTLEKQFAILKINQFGENTNREWDAAVNKILADVENGKITGIVLDLRDNPGGFLEGSVYIASEFLNKGSLVVKQDATSDSNDKDYSVFREGKLLTVPLVVLVNEGSASASEILAGALRDHDRAQLIGQKTFGKGSVQEALDLRGGAGLHVTVARWILPNGEWINGKGIEPQTKIENKVDENNTLTRETDVQLEKAIQTLLE